MTIEHATVVARERIRGHESAASWCFSFLGAGFCAFAAVNMTQGATWLTRGWLAVGCLYLAMPWVNRTFGVDLTPEFANVRGFRRRAVPWARVQAVVSDKKSNGAVVVRLILENGKPVRLPYPTTRRPAWATAWASSAWPWARRLYPRILWRNVDADYARDYERIGQWWLAHRGESWRPVRTQAPRPPSRELFLQHEDRGAMPRDYPVRFEGRLDPSTSRWVWVLKWILVVPHIVVLVLLGVGAVIAGLGAFFAILLTGRYPRVLFDYNVGVLRWAWRVSFYAFGAFATDRYPPFTLKETVDYPARLDVAYPEHLNRWLVLVKWLLAVPHLMVVGVLVGAGFSFLPPLYGSAVPWSGWDPITILATVAALILLFSGNYPRGLFDLQMGLNRWVYRVLAYMLLMADEYPPFRLDSGGDDPRLAQAMPVGPES